MAWAPWRPVSAWRGLGPAPGGFQTPSHAGCLSTCFRSFLYFYALLLSSAQIFKIVPSAERNVFVSIRGSGNIPQKVLTPVPLQTLLLPGAPPPICEVQATRCTWGSSQAQPLRACSSLPGWLGRAPHQRRAPWDCSQEHVRGGRRSGHCPKPACERPAPDPRRPQPCRSLTSARPPCLPHAAPRAVRTDSCSPPLGRRRPQAPQVQEPAGPGRSQGDTLPRARCTRGENGAQRSGRVPARPVWPGLPGPAPTQSLAASPPGEHSTARTGSVWRPQESLAKIWQLHARPPPWTLTPCGVAVLPAPSGADLQPGGAASGLGPPAAPPPRGSCSLLSTPRCRKFRARVGDEALDSNFLHQPRNRRRSVPAPDGGCWENEPQEAAICSWCPATCVTLRPAPPPSVHGVHSHHGVHRPAAAPACFSPLTRHKLQAPCPLQARPE